MPANFFYALPFFYFFFLAFLSALLFCNQLMVVMLPVPRTVAQTILVSIDCQYGNLEAECEA